MMRSTIFIILVCVFYAGTLAGPAKNKSACGGQQCEPSDDLICAVPKKGSGANIKFGSECVMNQYNCEHPGAEFVQTAANNCNDKTPVRLQ